MGIKKRKSFALSFSEKCIVYLTRMGFLNGKRFTTKGMNLSKYLNKLIVADFEKNLSDKEKDHISTLIELRHFTEERDLLDKKIELLAEASRGFKNGAD